MIEFFTDDFESLKDSLAPSEKCIPEWFKAQSSKCPVTHKFSSKPSEHVLTLKRCPGVLDYLTQGYTLKMWEDIEVSIKQDYLLDFNYKIENVDELTGWPYLSKSAVTESRIHHLSQFLDLPIRKNFNHSIKLTNPWRARSDKNIKLLVLPLILENTQFQIIPGVIETSFYHELHIPMLINSMEPFLIKKGTPILQYIPIIDNIESRICSTNNIDQHKLTVWKETVDNYNKLKSS